MRLVGRVKQGGGDSLSESLQHRSDGPAFSYLLHGLHFVSSCVLAQVGPMAFDLGCLIGNLFLAYFSLMEPEDDHSSNKSSSSSGTSSTSRGSSSAYGRPQQRKAQRVWLLSCVTGLWNGFVPKLRDAKQQQLRPSPLPDEALLLADTAGYAACCLTRLTIGMHHYPGEISSA